MNVVLTETALDDLVSIGRFIAADNRRRAGSFVAALEERCYQLGAMPFAYPLLPGREESGMRRRPTGNYLIFYRIEGEAVIVLRVLHGARDYEALLFPQE